MSDVLSGLFTSPTSGVSSGTQSSTTPVAPAPVLSPDDRYWAAQPQAVQALRHIPDDMGDDVWAPWSSRLNAAYMLAYQGYLIDVPIMVWQWDPEVTMKLRQEDGYTWVPSLLMRSVALSQGGLQLYSNLPIPAGGIAVKLP